MASSTAAGNLLSAYRKQIVEPLTEPQMDIYSVHIDIETITNLMSFHNLKFIGEDPRFVMRCIAGHDINEVDFETFNTFIHSPLWN